MLQKTISEFETVKIKHQTKCKKKPAMIRLLRPDQHMTGQAFSKFRKKVQESYQWRAFRIPCSEDEKIKFGIKKSHTFYWTCLQYKNGNNNDCSCGLRAIDGKSKNAPRELCYFEGDINDLNLDWVNIYRGKANDSIKQQKVAPTEGKLCFCGKWELFSRAEDPSFTIEGLAEEEICEHNGKHERKNGEMTVQETAEYSWVQLEKKVGEEIYGVACV